MSIGWPEGIWLALAAINLFFVLILNGVPRTDTWNFAATLANCLLSFGLLYWGGFFA